ncbi:hypothetical protein BJP36_44020 [Moorena producens JHB]|uniref:Uncharacterized protein n=1 Tax=Moorena producens (strain JHB) TaxID=1454205 RepID=A0A9Q9STG7_MOOP1|nr:hypothetical protein [Moorena producens]WAN69327.1 hypothetical protein BJP36_44020 [Moorena producens JHB]
MESGKLKPENSIGRRPRYAIAYKYSISPTISSRIDSVYNSNEVHRIFSLII